MGSRALSSILENIRLFEVDVLYSTIHYGYSVVVVYKVWTNYS